jgi:hypothetical protein
MVERHSSAVQQVAGVGQQTVEDVRLTQSAVWTPSGLITSRSGMVPSGTAAAPGSVLATTPTPNGFVHVQPFRAVLQSSRSGGTYTLCLDAIKDINILSTSADPSNARRDLIIAQQSDTYIGGDVNSDMVVKQVVGTPSGSPVDPTVTGSADYLVLARVTVTAGATTITTGNITQLATQLTVATGGMLPVADATERAAIANPYDGMQIYRRDLDWIETYDGGAWRAPMWSRTTALANITNPVTGQHTYLTTDLKLYRWNGSTWAFVQPMDGSTPWGTQGTPTSVLNSTGITTTDTIQVEKNTINVVSGRRYRIYHTRNEAFNSGANNRTNKYRVASGATVTTAATQIGDNYVNGLTGGYNTFQFLAEWLSTFTGQATFGVSSSVNTGTALVDGARAREFRIEDIGF